MALGQSRCVGDKLHPRRHQLELQQNISRPCLRVARVGGGILKVDQSQVGLRLQEVDI